MSEKQVQMTLDLTRKNRFSKEHFIYGVSNQEASQWMRQKKWPEGRLWVWGATGCGKSHFLHLWAEENKAFMVEASSISRNSEGEIFLYKDPLIDPVGNMAIDHLENLQDEVALLHILNRARAENCKILLAGRLPPACFPVTLPDLQSRLRASMVVEIKEPDDMLRGRLLLSLIAEKQLIIGPTVIDFLLKHLPRTGEALVNAVARLDEAALIRGQAISRTLAQEVLNL